jgi:hypothetical protein
MAAKPAPGTSGTVTAKSSICGGSTQQAAPMHGALHAMATAIALPYALLAVCFAMVGELARARGLSGVVDALLAHAAWFVSWGVYLIPLASLAALSIAAAGFFSRLRRVAALSLIVLSGSSLLTIVLLHAGPLDSGHLLFLLPCVGVLLVSIWLFRRAEQPAGAPAAA